MIEARVGEHSAKPDVPSRRSKIGIDKPPKIELSAWLDVGVVGVGG